MTSSQFQGLLLKDLVNMRRAVFSLPAGIGHINPSEARSVGTMIPKKHTNGGPAEVYFRKEQTEPAVAFSRPPPIPPYLGPLILFSLLDAWLRRDKNDG